MRFDLRTLDETAMDAEREARLDAERDALAEWDALPAAERERRRELADALTPEEFR